MKKTQVKKLVLILLVLVLMLASATAGYLYVSWGSPIASLDIINSEKNSGNSPTVALKITEPPKPVYVASPINGIMLEQSVYNLRKSKPVLAVMIQNHSLSRPQWGLGQADVVYEALAEGGITRFMGIFWSQDAAKIMSVRSARKYFVDLTGDYQKPIYMHIGYAEGADNVNALKAISTYGLQSLGLGGGTSFFRDQTCQKTKAIEHCAYTNTETLWANAAKNNWGGNIDKMTALVYKDDIDYATSTYKQLSDFTVNFGSAEGGLYSTRWKYNEATKMYLRFNPDGTSFKEGDGNQVSSKVVIYQKINSVPAGDTKNHVVQDVIGSGTGYIMQNGYQIPVTWKKTNYSSRTKFYLESGEEFTFERGKMWIMLVPKQFEPKNNTVPAT